MSLRSLYSSSSSASLGKRTSPSFPLSFLSLYFFSTLTLFCFFFDYFYFPHLCISASFFPPSLIFSPSLPPAAVLCSSCCFPSIFFSRPLSSLFSGVVHIQGFRGVCQTPRPSHPPTEISLLHQNSDAQNPLWILRLPRTTRCQNTAGAPAPRRPSSPAPPSNERPCLHCFPSEENCFCSRAKRLSLRNRNLKSLNVLVARKLPR